MFQELRDILRAAGVPMEEEDLLDVLWLAARVPSGPVAPLAARAPETVTPSEDIGPVPPDLRVTRGPSAPGDAVSGDEPLVAAEHRQEQAEHVGLTSGPTPAASVEAVWTPGARALGSALPLGRALRPLKRRTPGRRRTELDEAATAELQADTRTPQMVLRAQPQRWLRLALVIDGGMSMLLWERQCAELKAIFERSGAFRQVEVYQIRYEPGSGDVRLGRPWSTTAAARPAGCLADASGQTMVLVVTDGAAAAWRDGRMRPVVEGWARQGPTAVVHTLSRRLWAGSGVRADTWQITSPRPGAPNRAWTAADQVLPPGVAPVPAVPVPVLELTPGGFATWAAVNTVVGRPVPVRLWTPRRAAGRADEPVRVSVRDFSRAASPEALRLAAHLAAMAPVTVPVMQLVHSCLDQGQGAVPLAEVLLGGLLQPLPSSQGAQLAGRHRLFDFTAEAKDLLLDAVPTAELIDCSRRVGERIESLTGGSSDFPAWLVNSRRNPDAPGTAVPFAYLGPALQARLGLPAPAPDLPPDDIAADMVVLSPSVDSASEWLSSIGLGGSLRTLFDALGGHVRGFADIADVSPAELDRYREGTALPRWGLVMALVDEVAEFRGEPPADVRARLRAQYIDAALSVGPSELRAPFDRMRDAMRQWRVPQEAELLLVHLLLYLHARFPTSSEAGQWVRESEVVLDLWEFLQERGIAPEVEALYEGQGVRRRYDLVWFADGHSYPLEVRRGGSHSMWPLGPEPPLFFGELDEAIPVAFCLVVDESDEPDGPVPLDECVKFWAPPAEPRRGGPVIGLRLKTTARSGMRSAPARRVCVVVRVEALLLSSEASRLKGMETLWAITDVALRTAGVPLDECVTQDRGDGLIILLPSGTDEAIAVPAVIDGLGSGLRNVHEQGRSMRLRVAMDEGHVDVQGSGVLVGEAVPRTSRLLDSAVLRDAMATQPHAEYGLIVSEPLYRRVPALHGRFQRVRVDLEGYRAWAWMQPVMSERPSGLPDPTRSNAVLIGSSTYENLSDLPAVQSGLDDLRALLTDPSVGAFTVQRTTVLANPVHPGEALDAVEDAARSAEDTLLVYFAGHGLLDARSGELGLAVHVTRPESPHTAVPYGDIRYLLSMSTARHKVVILDCCYSGRALGSPRHNYSTRMDLDAEGTFVMAAASGESAMVPSGERHTAFTGELIKVLDDGLGSGAELISLESLHAEMYQRLRARNLPLPQYTSRNAAHGTVIARNRAYIPR